MVLAILLGELTYLRATLALTSLLNRHPSGGKSVRVSKETQSIVKWIAETRPRPKLLLETHVEMVLYRYAGTWIQRRCIPQGIVAVIDRSFLLPPIIFPRRTNFLLPKELTEVSYGIFLPQRIGLSRPTQEVLFASPLHENTRSTLVGRAPATTIERFSWTISCLGKIMSTISAAELRELSCVTLDAFGTPRRAPAWLN